MRIRRSAVIVAGIIMFISGAAFFYAWLQPRTHIVVRTAEGFEPRDLAVRKGDMVRFFAEHGEEYWPASDAHPSHAFYGQFDPRHPISPDEPWTMVFDRPGLWPYHDHLHPGVRGTINVSGPTPSLEECISYYGTSTSQSFCWGQTLMQVIRDEGVAAAFEAIEPMHSTPEFEQQCHDVMHILGQATYGDFIEDPDRVQTNPLTTACGYGFYHGFIETMLVDLGRGDMRTAHDYCESLATTQGLGTDSAQGRASEACYHGVGHALFDTIDSSLWGSARRMVSSVTRECERLTENPMKQEICMSGVYNSLANAFANRDYYLAFEAGSDRICAEEPFRYQHRCYIEVSTSMLRNLKYDYDTSIAHIRSLPAHSRWTTLRAYIDGELRHQTVDLTPAKATALCEAFADTDERLDCLSGALRAFTYMSPSGGEELAQKLFSICTAERVSDLSSQCARKARAHLASQMEHEHTLALCERAMPDKSFCSGPAGDL
jgi:plastocyanin